MLKKILIFILLSISVIKVNAAVIDLGEIVVTGERFENTLRDSNRNVYVITSETLNERGIKNIFEALQIIPGAHISDWTGSGKTGVIDLRGQGEAAKTNVLVMIDGVSINSIDMAIPDYNQISIEQVERIEVLTGGASVLYGDKAVGGVINIITKTVKKNGLSGNIKFDYSSYAALLKGANIAYKQQKYNISASYFQKIIDGYRMNSKYKADDAAVKFDYNFSQTQKFSYSFQYHNDEYGLPGALSEAQNFSDRKQTANPNDWAASKNMRHIITYKHQWTNFMFENTFGYFTNKIEDKMISWGRGRVETENEKITNALLFKFERANNKFISGADYQTANSENEGNKIKKNSIAVFALNNYKLFDKLALSAGGRKEKTELKYYTAKTKKYDENIFEGGLNYFFSNTGNLFINISENYRTPVTDEYFEKGNPLWPLPDHYNETLEPQKGVNTEIGLREQLFDKFTFIVSAYKNSIKDEIYYNTVIWHNDNMPGKTTRRGFDITAEQRLTDNIVLKEVYSRLSAKFKDGIYKDKTVPGAPKDKFSAELSIKLPELINIFINYNYTSGAYAISNFNNTDGKTKSYNITNLKFNKEINNFTFNFGVNNIFNEIYSEYIVDYGWGKNYYPSPERNYYGSINYNF